MTCRQPACQVPDCPRPAAHRGLCTTHYYHASGRGADQAARQLAQRYILPSRRGRRKPAQEQSANEALMAAQHRPAAGPAAGDPSPSSASTAAAKRIGELKEMLGVLNIPCHDLTGLLPGVHGDVFVIGGRKLISIGGDGKIVTLTITASAGAEAVPA